ncbi:hypothetical protein RBH26_05115 [Natronolimnohabitans sp. A-GB9]|uniref:hypothetical protein n=1 Tax=Natronolimnohabitans sp. A-GB9 TaxID=3069757 RepID=UPI0027B2A494|nr:hypothetical protein [Natronolimnohabitans sp. A-GB9]MDQ2049858.1 hypothetical protein [Natronolimnohabitans sp. A-GB9]
MRRADDSRAVERDTDDPFTPAATDEGSRHTIDWEALSHAFLPVAVRHRAIDVSITTDRDVYAPGDPVSIGIEFRNRLPFPVRLRTDSPEPWTWAVDGATAASRLERPIPDRPDTFSFARSERKRFRREWPQRIRIADDEWTPVDSGQYTLEAWINREDAADCGLVATTEIEIRE